MMSDHAENERDLVCGLCGVSLTPLRTTFSYLNREFKHTVMRCPKCGLVYIPEELAEGRMKEVESILEDK